MLGWKASFLLKSAVIRLCCPLCSAVFKALVSFDPIAFMALSALDMPRWDLGAAFCYPGFAGKADCSDSRFGGIWRVKIVAFRSNWKLAFEKISMFPAACWLLS